MNLERTPGNARTRPVLRSSAVSVSGKRDRFISRPDRFSILSASPLPVVSQENAKVLTSPTGLGKTDVPQKSLMLMRVIDAPYVSNDYHLNLLSWSQTDVLIVGLQRDAFLYSVQTCRTAQLKCADTITAVAAQSGSQLIALGTEQACVRVYDIETMKLVSELKHHEDRVATLTWSNKVLVSGSRDCSIRLNDIRTASMGAVLKGHSGEVCTLAVNPLTHELASGGNDNRVLIWELRSPQVRTNGLHRSCVKALLWSPWKVDRLHSGAGFADRSIKEWSTGGQLTCVQEIDTGAQVSSILWDQWERRLISGHGYPHCKIMVWDEGKMYEEYSQQEGRVLSLASGPAGDMMASLSADETVRLWKLGNQSESEDESLSAHTRRYTLAR